MKNVLGFFIVVALTIGSVPALRANRIVLQVEAVATDAGMSAAFAGVVRLTNQVSGGATPIAVCTASDHRLLFTRQATTMSRMRF
jgi:hypothetical protein